MKNHIIPPLLDPESTRERAFLHFNVYFLNGLFNVGRSSGSHSDIWRAAFDELSVSISYFYFLFHFFFFFFFLMCIYFLRTL